MKRILFLSLFFIGRPALAQQAENMIIITTDGLRWQELFMGMDSAIANNPAFNQRDSAYIFSNYWSENASERRKKLMPFFWSGIEQQGQIYGNRLHGNFVNNSNPYWFSYPGYSEIFTGFPDEKINSNEHPDNPHKTILEFLNEQEAFKGKLAAFTAWHAFNRILAESRAGFPVIAAYDTVPGKDLSAEQKLLNTMLLNSHRPWKSSECLDMFTHYSAMDYLKNKKPKVLYIGYGETDEWAHAGQYRFYLDAARQFDSWVREIWEYLQSQPQYRNKTALLITTDHGRGDKVKKQWTDHGSKVSGADEIWLALIAPGVAAKGELKINLQIYQKQFAQTIARLLGQTYSASHPIGEPVNEIWK